MDPENPVVKRCVAGMQAEGKGDLDAARRLFAEAWEIAGDDFERCIAAHYVARHQTTPEETLRWNHDSLRLAESVGDERVDAFFPSLLLNLGHAYEAVGQSAEAKTYYELASAKAEGLPGDRYGKIVRDGIASGQQRLVAEPRRESDNLD